MAASCRCFGAAAGAFQHPVGTQADIAFAGGQHVLAQQRPLMWLQCETQAREVQHLTGLDGGGPFRPAVRLLPVAEIDLDDG